MTVYLYLVYDRFLIQIIKGNTFKSLLFYVNGFIYLTMAKSTFYKIFSYMQYLKQIQNKIYLNKVLIYHARLAV